MSAVQEAIRRRYGQWARARASAADASAPVNDGCCGAPDLANSGCGCGYPAAELTALGLTPAASLGCGNPTLLADLRPGEVVLDLGSGGGLDVLLSARRVSPGGHAYGLDATAEMVALAEGHRARAGIANATFLQGTMEAIPLADASVDVVISNCVINLAEDKATVIREAYRVLRPGGRLAISDLVELEPLAPAVKRNLDAWAGWVAGTIPVQTYTGMLREAGFTDSQVEVREAVGPADHGGRIGSASIRARKPKEPAPGG